MTWAELGQAPATKFIPMKVRHLSFVVAVVLASATLGADSPPIAAPKDKISRVVFPQATVNGQAAVLVLDTGSSSSLLTDSGAERLGLEVLPLTGQGVAYQLKDNTVLALAEAARVTAGAETITVQMPVLNFSTPGGASFDGIIGWPEVRNNLLQFDAEAREVRGLDEFPATIANWQKFKIHPNSVLTLETVLPDGNVAEITVDTGSEHGVALSPARWKEWRAAHPRTATTSSHGFMPGVGAFEEEESWADEIRIGDFTLTNLLVREANAAGNGHE